MARRIVSDSEDDSDVPLGTTVNADAPKTNGSTSTPAANGKRKLSVSAEDPHAVSFDALSAISRCRPGVRWLAAFSSFSTVPDGGHGLIENISSFYITVL